MRCWAWRGAGHAAQEVAASGGIASRTGRGEVGGGEGRRTRGRGIDRVDRWIQF